ncbi:MAG: hypothetical protein ACE5HI_14835, partial [bacterium]
MIHRNIFMKLQLPFLIVILLTNTAHSKNTSQELVTLHEAIGPVIDANENERFYLFSRDVGLIAAKVYHRSADKWLLHLLGEKDGKPWMLIRSLGAEQKMKLTNRIRNGLNKQKAETEESPSFSAPVYKIELPLEFATDQPVKIKLEDNTQLYGRLIQCRQDTIQFVTLTDLKLEISENKITEIRWPQGEIFEGAFLKYDPNHIRLFFGPTGRTLKKGEANFADFYVFFPTLAVGLTDFVMIGGGVSLIPGARTQLFYVSPKVRLMHLENIDLAAGLLYMVVPEEGSFTSAYTVFSYGNPLGGLTIGV